MSGRRLSIEDFLNASEGVPLLDVRSPGEYTVGHIPSAVSFPLFTNQERAVIGTLYKQEGRDEAIKKGLEIVGPKMRGFVEQAEALDSKKLALYCWRGGMRSDSMSWLLERYGFETQLLEGGYKAYRNYMLDFFKQDLPLLVLTGYTGSQKTGMLQLLRKKGEQVVDLEGLAGHQGSTFGNQKSKRQPSTEHFQNMVLEAFRKLDLSRPVWVEDEDIRIGMVNLVEALFRQMSESPHIFMEVEKEQRVSFLLDDYGKLTDEQLITATHYIRKRLGYDRAKEAIEYIQEGNRKAAAEIILTYYDSRYQRSISRKENQVKARLQVDTNKLEQAADQLIKLSKDVLQTY